MAHPELIVNVIGPAVEANKSVVTSAWCLRHKRRCSLSTAKVHIAGTPCTDFSKQGKEMKLAGVTMLYLLAWIALRLALQEPVIVQENVTEFPTAILTEYLGRYYFIDTCTEDSMSFGWPSRRNRRWIIMRHRAKTTNAISPLSRFTQRFYRVCKTTWVSFFVAEKSEQEEEQAWAAGRPKSIASCRGLKLSIDTPGAFELSLTEPAAENLLGNPRVYYVSRFKAHPIRNMC